RIGDIPNDGRLDLVEDILEDLPWLPSIQPRGHLALANREGRESGDLEALALLAVFFERPLRSPVLEGLGERIDVESNLPRDIRLDSDPVNRPCVQAPGFAEGPEVSPTGMGSLQVGRLRGDACRPRRIEVLDRLDHTVRVHWHLMLRADRLKERADGVGPSASRHPRPLLADRRKVLEQPSLADAEFHGVRICDLEAPDHRLAAPA